MFITKKLQKNLKRKQKTFKSAIILALNLLIRKKDRQAPKVPKKTQQLTGLSVAQNFLNVKVPVYRLL